MPDLSVPPVARYDGPIVDAHVHIKPPERMRQFLRMAEAYGVGTYMGIADLDTVAACRAALPGRVVGIARPTFEDIADTAGCRRRVLTLLGRAVDEQDVRGVKFWFKPQFNASSGLYWDDARLDFVFDFMVEHRLVALIHIADPDIWFHRVYSDTARFGTKADAYGQLERRMRRHPGLLVQAAHLGGDPEHLDHLEALLADHANLHFDLSATKWVARELSAKPEQAREFVIRHADRLLWGSDLVVARQADMTFDDYATRYYVHRHLWEGTGRLLSPIEDADAGRPVMVAGLELPLDVLGSIYARNAERLYRIRAAPCPGSGRGAPRPSEG